MMQMKEMSLEIRSKNLERKKYTCLMCSRLFMTTRGNRVCGKCHKLTDNRFYDSEE